MLNTWKIGRCLQVFIYFSTLGNHPVVGLLAVAAFYGIFANPRRSIRQQVARREYDEEKIWMPFRDKTMAIELTDGVCENLRWLHWGCSC